MSSNRHHGLDAFIRHDSQRGTMTFMEQRMLMVHAFSLAALRKELLEALGIERARKVMMRIGYQQGVEDAKSISRHDKGGVVRLFEFGPAIREMEGFAHHRAIDRLQLDENTGEFWGDYAWENSWEAQAHTDAVGLSGTPACWMMTGYACGYSTFLMGRPILWKETQCTAMGHAHCRVVGLPLEEEPEAEKYLDFMEVEPFISAPKPRHSRTEARPAERAAAGDHGLPDMVGLSSGFAETAWLCRKVADTSTTVLLLGESGVGKERFARAIHSISRSADGPFMAVNCAAIPRDLVESELFGVEKGAFTGAQVSRKGKFERAHGGTLFLDEIGCLPFEAQGKLLRAIQERVIEPVGGSDDIRVEFRLIAATNRDLEQEVAAGRFRADLYYRLNVFPIRIPPLRERSDDIPLLVNLFIQRFARAAGKEIKGVSRSAFDRLLLYPWPGNVRELENICERAVIMAESGGFIDVEHLKLPSTGPLSDNIAAHAGADDVTQAWELLLSGEPSYAEFERQLLQRALERCDGNLSAAARLLQIKRGQFEYRYRKAQQP